MKKRIIRNLMSVFIVILFIISIFFIPAIADPGDGKGNGNGDVNPKNSSKGPNDEDGGDDSSGYHNQEGNDDEDDDNSGEYNGNDDDDDENNQYRYQHREGDEDNDDVDDEQERYQHRKMEMEFEENRLRIRSDWGQDNYEDEFEILFDIEDGPYFKLEYENNMHTSENELSFEVKIRELIEYIDKNLNGRFDEDDDIVNTYSLERPIFKNLSYQKKLSDNNETINLVSTQTEDHVFKMNLYFSNNFSNLNNQVLTPSELKIDFIIDKFPYEEKDTLLALRAMLETDHEIELEVESFDEINGFSENESVFNITTTNNGGFFSWAETAIVDGIEKSVNSTINIQKEETITENEKNSNQVTNLYFSYPRGNNIFHDPKIGIVSISFGAYALKSISNLINMDSILSYIGICIFASILFLGIIVIRKRL
jgi:hypothetical protein